MKKEIRLIALDMDGTLYNHQSQISQTDQDTIRQATQNGIEVAISTGRPYIGLPIEQLTSIGIRYAITSNGAAVYHLPGKECIYTNCMEPDLVCPILMELQKKDIHMDAFINGNGYGLASCKPKIRYLDMPESIRAYIYSSRTFIDDLASFIQESRSPVQKITLNFYPLPDGTFQERENVKSLLSSHPEITFLSGGYHNLEFTKAGTTKALGLKVLCEALNINLNETMACGDTHNDFEIIKTAGIGVAMANAIPEIKSAADFITYSNEESGVSHAIRTFTSI